MQPDGHKRGETFLWIAPVLGAKPGGNGGRREWWAEGLCRTEARRVARLNSLEKAIGTKASPPRSQSQPGLLRPVLAGMNT